jgi:hypothetical protein
MRSILWDRWDPLALTGLVPDDEYDSYANVLASKLKRGNDRSDIVAYLTTCLIDRGTPITPAWTARCEATADALLAWYRQSNSPR